MIKVLILLISALVFSIITDEPFVALVLAMLVIALVAAFATIYTAPCPKQAFYIVQQMQADGLLDPALNLPSLRCRNPHGVQRQPDGRYYYPSIQQYWTFDSEMRLVAASYK